MKIKRSEVKSQLAAIVAELLIQKDVKLIAAGDVLKKVRVK